LISSFLSSSFVLAWQTSTLDKPYLEIKLNPRFSFGCPSELTGVIFKMITNIEPSANESMLLHFSSKSAFPYLPTFVSQGFPLLSGDELTSYFIEKQNQRINYLITSPTNVHFFLI
jgi:hypothetical protein